jgi:hypothetical protein
MPILRYEICADEAWTHTSPPLNRYWCFYGGIFGPAPDCDRLESALRAVVRVREHRGEIKWKSVTAKNIDTYKLLVDLFFDHVSRYPLTYRQVFLDRSYVHVPSSGDPALSDLDVQFRICYQFLKHSFGLRYLAPSNSGHQCHVDVRLDNHSSQKHTDRLIRFVQDLPRHWGLPTLTTKVRLVNSEHYLRLQLCDLVMGAAGSHGNRMHQRREPGQRGMTPKQKCRHEMATFIYKRLRSLDATERGTLAFNWFESTGHDGAVENRLHHKLRIWKFIPKRYRKDEGWQNKHLDSQGRYIGPRLLPAVVDQTRAPFDYD